MNRKIIISNACEHNLKSVALEIPHHRLIVVTGVSGSGKSSLVFDTIGKEAERRYLESLSSYARQFIGKLTRPAVEYIGGLTPVITIDQKTGGHNPRSTVGTMTELYDYLRLFFSRMAQLNPAENNGDITPDRRLFSFNTPQGACPACKGLGVQDHIDIDLLVENPGKTLREGALTITTPTGYIIYSQVTMDVLNQVCTAHGFDVNIPWKDMSPEQKHIVLYGSDKIKIPYGKHTLESRMKWTGITAKPREEGFYKGIIPVMENILRVDRNANILRFARSMKCSSCKGTRLNPQALSITFGGLNIGEMAAMTIDELHNHFTDLKFSPGQTPIGEPIRRTFLERTDLLIQLGLGYLTLDRESTTLSSGESQRIRLSTQLGSGLRGITYVLDEPSVGLHHRDNKRLLEILNGLKDNGCTVIVVEHDEETIRNADWLIDVGPAAGIHGGEILFNGTITEFLDAPCIKNSRTHAFLTGTEIVYNFKSDIRPGERGGDDLNNGRSLTVRGASEHNLKHIDVPFRLGALNVVTGVSGAGKSTLVHDILANALRKQLHNAQCVPGKCESIEGIEFIDKIIEIDQSPIGRTPRSNPATYTQLFDLIRDLFASLPESIENKWDKSRFSFNVKGGRCETCEGAGVLQIGMHFLGDVDIPCDSCGGQRFNDETLSIGFNGKNIYQILEMSVETASTFFKDYPKIQRHLQALLDLGLGYITLGQPATTFSGGEAQRIKLASELCRPNTGKTLYILDEPTTGLHFADIKILLLSLKRLVQLDNTVITVEHHPDFIKQADWIIDLGPESGTRGGELVAFGPPHTVAQNPRSHTGAFLKQSIEKPHLSVTSEKTANVHPIDSRILTEPIRMKGVSTHNLKHIDVEIPLNTLTVITGVSGSGKSSLAFDTLHAECRQRFLSQFSTYARRLLPQTSGAQADEWSGLMPTIAVNRKTSSRNPRSTVGTATDIYDYYRLLFARIGKSSPGEKQKTLTASMFSFNHHQGACPLCKGLGIITTCDPHKLVTHPDRSLLSGAMDGTKTGQFYGDPYGQYTAILQTAGQENGIDYTLPWNALDKIARDIAMLGTGDKLYSVEWKFKRKEREGEHRFNTAWKGFIHYVNEEYERKHADKRGENMLELMSDRVCPQCAGQRLKPVSLSVKVAGLTISELCRLTVEESITLFNAMENRPNSLHANDADESPTLTANELSITDGCRKDILKRLSFLNDVGLGYLSLDRTTATLSGGEGQRIRLAGQLSSGLTQICYILDEPTIGLHPRDTQQLLKVLKQLRDIGNTVVIVEHDADIIREADYIIDMGPGSGTNGGAIVAQGTLPEIKSNPNSLTGQYLENPNSIPTPHQRRPLTEGIKITGICVHNLKNLDVEFPAGGIIALTGVSGSGKSTLLFDVIAPSAEKKEPIGCHTITGFHHFDEIILMDQEDIGMTSASNPATYTGIFDHIRDIFAQTPTAREMNLKKNHFSFNVKGGRCETCQGTGQIRTSMDFLPDVWSTCEDCKGKRYNAQILGVFFHKKNISDVLNMTIHEASLFFREAAKENATRKYIAEIDSTLELLIEVGLGYLTLGQPSNTLSGGEAQRLKLVSQLIKRKKEKDGNKSRCLYLLDEPTTGLHFEDVRKLLILFHRLADQGHTLIIIEHHPDIIKNADHVVELFR